MQQEKQEKGFIKYIVIIIFILAVAFLSQKIYSRGTEKIFVFDAVSQAAGAYIAKGTDWIASAIYPKISGEVQKRGDAIKTEINQEKNKISENIGEKIKNYFSGITDSILHPGDNNNCQVQPSQSPAAQ